MSVAKNVFHGCMPALMELSKLDEGPDLVLFYKRLMVLEGYSEYAHQINKSDALDASQEAFIEAEWQRFRDWWASWSGTED